MALYRAGSDVATVMHLEGLYGMESDVCDCSLIKKCEYSETRVSEFPYSK